MALSWQRRFSVGSLESSCDLTRENADHLNNPRQNQWFLSRADVNGGDRRSLQATARTPPPGVPAAGGGDGQYCGYSTSEESEAAGG